MRILPDAIEDNYGIVYGISDHGQYRRDERIVHLDVEYGIKRYQYEHVVQNARYRRHTVFPRLESEYDVQKHAHGGDQNGSYRIGLYLITYGRLKLFRRNDRFIAQIILLLYGFLNLISLVRVQRLCGLYYYLVLFAPGIDYIRIQVILFYGLLYIGDLNLFVHVHLHDGSAGKVNSEVESSYDKGYKSYRNNGGADKIKYLPSFNYMETALYQFSRSSVRVAAEEAGLLDVPEQNEGRRFKDPNNI